MRIVNAVELRPSTVAAGTTVELSIRGAEIAGITDPAKITFSDSGLKAIEVKRAMEDVVDLVDELTVTVAVGPLEIDDGQGGTETIPEQDSQGADAADTSAS